MKAIATLRAVILLAAVSFFASGCATPALTYVQQHPELTPEQKQIFHSGKIPGGEAVSGLTREQVRIAMSGDPDTFDKINGEDVWIYNRKRLNTENRMANNEVVPSSTFNTRGAGDANPNSDALSMGPDHTGLARTTIFFHGDRATHAQVSD